MELVSRKKKKIIIANWKMNLSLVGTSRLAENMKKKFNNITRGEIVLCPNFISLLEVNKIIKDSILKLGAQHVFWEEAGAYTGEVSPQMLLDAGCEYVIIGHSERRSFLMENNEMINRELKAVLKTEKLVPIVCIGENLNERKTDRRDFVLSDQLQQALGEVDIYGNQQIIIAYEPVWAIGSGTAIELREAEYAHKVIRVTLNNLFGEKKVNNNFRIIYGGSVNRQNANQFNNLENMDGLLVGGASLDCDNFYKITTAFIE